MAGSEKILGRIYFFSLLPLLGSALGPWIFGPKAPIDLNIFLLWSLALLIVPAAAFWGFSLTHNARMGTVSGFINVFIVALGVAAMVLALRNNGIFAAVALFTVLHWCSWLWVQKTLTLTVEFKKQHNRFVWTAIACHMFVAFNVIYVARVSG